MGLSDANNCASKVQIDNLLYTLIPGTPRLQKVADSAPAANRAKGFNPGASPGSDYVYDQNGNLITDPYKGLTIQYNFLNLPKLITKGGSNISIRYDATGRKWSQAGPEGIREYVGGVEYLDQEIQSVQHGEGRLVPTYSGTSIASIRAEYWRQDHLGNTRVAFSDFNLDRVIATKDDPNTTENDVEITQENHYYPFGLNQEGPWYQTVMPKNKYQYSGVERVEDLGVNLDLALFRSYDPSLGRWNQRDPLSQLASNWSPYRFGFNNPILLTDPLGLWEHIEGGWRTNDTEEISEFLKLQAKASETGGQVNYTDVNSGGVAFTMWSIGENGSFHGTLHNNPNPSPGAGYFAFQSAPNEPAIAEGPSQSLGHARSISAGFAFMGGFGIEIGWVKDQMGNTSFYNRWDCRIGMGMGVDYNSVEVVPSPGNIFTLDQWAGYDNYSEISVAFLGYGYGQNQNEWGKAGDPILTPGAIAGNLYTVRNIPVSVSDIFAELRERRFGRGIRARPLKSKAGFGFYRSWGFTNLW